VESKGRPAGTDLNRELGENAHQFSLFQLIRLLEKMNGEGIPIGKKGPAAEENIRLRPPLSLGFPTAEVLEVEVEQEKNRSPRFRIETAVIGLYGSQSPLPSYFTEDLLQEEDPEESLVRGFLDIFHHRLISLLYRCWQKYRYFVQFQPKGKDPFSARMFSLIGMALDGERYGAVPAQRFIRYSGLHSQKPVSAAALRCAVSDYFSNTPTEITQNIFRWVPIPADRRCRLGDRHSTLGRDLHMGRKMPDRSGKFRVTLGPLGIEKFVTFLPGEMEFLELDEIIRRFVNDMLQFEVEVVLIRREIPAFQLRNDSGAARLGHTSWLGKPSQDGQVVFQETRRLFGPESKSGGRSAAA
jgi:type VI secretion system protein ImpH